MHKKLLGFSLMTLACCSAIAQTPAITSAAQKAIETNPEVAAKFNAFRASIDEVGVAAGALKPRVDLTGDVGRTQDVIEGHNPDTQSLNRAGIALSINQLLWDGMATSNEVKRLGHAKMARYFEFVDATEQTALEAARAFHDVERFRRLVKLAEDNYVQHKYALDQIQSRVKAGVGRGVDLEQSGARLALAESNLVTEKANLHDVSERYRRIVGEAPPASPESTSRSLAKPLPATSTAVLEATVLNNASIAAAIENLRATRAQAESRKGAYQPRLEARVRGGVGKNFDGIEDQKRDISAQLVMNWNLFNGGSDDARQRQSANLLNQAADLRDKACRDARQTSAIAYNDVAKLTEQLEYLDRNVIAIEKARDAYRQQFDIGQRSLLDLLNAENELYTAKRAYSIASADLDIAIARSHAGMGTLVSALGLARADTKTMVPESESWAAGEDAAGRCPISATGIDATSKADLDARARAIAKPAPVPPAQPAATPIAKTPAGLAEQRLRDWAAAWMSKDLTRYYSFYSPNFGPLKHDKAKWQSERKRLVTKPGEITVTLGNLKATQISPTRVETSFDQVYRSYNFNDQMSKTLTWELSGSEWLIVKETNR